MNQVIGDLLPLALVVAISPFPIIAAILMLLSPKGKANSVGFLLGWTVGILLAVIVFTFLSGFTGESSDGPKPIAGVVKIVLGVLLVLLGIRQLRNRPAAGAEIELPKWMQAIESMTAVRAAGLGLLLGGVNPKNLIMAASAGVVIGTAGLSVGGVVAATAIYVVIAILTIAVPVIGALIAGPRLQPMLKALSAWLTANNTIILAAILILIGVMNVGKGIGSF